MAALKKELQNKKEEMKKEKTAGLCWIDFFELDCSCLGALTAAVLATGLQ